MLNRLNFVYKTASNKAKKKNAMKGQCKFEGIYFVFSLPTQKKEEAQPTLQNISKPSQANAQSKGL